MYSSEQLIQTHLNPIKFCEFSSNKGLIPTKTTEEIEQTENALKSLKTFFQQPRVERKNSRSEAIWDNDKRKCKLVRKVGKIYTNFGHTESGVTYLTPEESLYLLETNYLDIYWNGVPFSIEQAYFVLLNSKDMIEKYRVFKELAKLDFKIHQIDNNERYNCTESKTNKRRKIESNEFEELLNNLKENGPKTANINSSYSTIYNVNLPKSATKKTTPDFEIIKKPNTPEFSLQCTSNKDSSTVTSFSGNGSVSFYQFHEVDL